jgi:hypothetical protein
MTDTHQAAPMFADLRERAERRGRIEWPDGSCSYSTPGWSDVIRLLEAHDMLVRERDTLAAEARLLVEALISTEAGRMWPDASYARRAYALLDALAALGEGQ